MYGGAKGLVMWYYDLQEAIEGLMLEGWIHQVRPPGLAPACSAGPVVCCHAQPSRLMCGVRRPCGMHCSQTIDDDHFQLLDDSYVSE
jgi:hypothetical protein